jgi:hypothetical protein
LENTEKNIETLSFIQKFEKSKFFSKNITSYKISFSGFYESQERPLLPGWKNLPLK